MSNGDSARLDRLAKHVHNAVRMLKLGDTGTISLNDFTETEIRQYLFAYGLHKSREGKDKWFSVRADKVSRSLTVERVPKPAPKAIEREEEVE